MAIKYPPIEFPRYRRPSVDALRRTASLGMSLEQLKRYVSQHGYYLALVPPEYQTEALCEAAVKNDGMALQFVANQTDRICRRAVMNCGYALQYVKHQSREITAQAVAQNPLSIIFADNPTPGICMNAISKQNELIGFIRNQTPEMCQFAMLFNGMNLEYVRDPDLNTCVAAVFQSPKSFRFIPKELQEPVRNVLKLRRDAYATVKRLEHEGAEAGLDKAQEELRSR